MSFNKHQYPADHVVGSWVAQRGLDEGGGSGGGDFPTYYQQDVPDSPSDGETWIRPRVLANDDVYPNQFGVGLFRWSDNADEWMPIAPVALDADGNLLGQITVGGDGNIILERFDGDDNEMSFIAVGDYDITIRVDSGDVPHYFGLDSSYGACIDGIPTEGLVDLKLFRGDWVADTYYNIGEVVIGPDTNSYVVKQSHFNVEPGTDGNLWYQIGPDFPPLVIKSLPADWGGVEIGSPADLDNGIDAPMGSLYLNNQHGSDLGSVQVKFGPGKTDWTSLATSLGASSQFRALNPVGQHVTQGGSTPTYNFTALQAIETASSDSNWNVVTFQAILAFSSAGEAGSPVVLNLSQLLQELPDFPAAYDLMWAMKGTWQGAVGQAYGSGFLMHPYSPDTNFSVWLCGMGGQPVLEAVADGDVVYLSGSMIIGVD